MSTEDKGTAGADRIAVYGSLAEARAEFGENWGAFMFHLTSAQVEALLEGRVVAFDIGQREYAGFLVLDEADKMAGTADPGDGH